MKTKIILRIVLYALILALLIPTLVGSLLYGTVFRNGVFSNSRPKKTESASAPTQMTADGTVCLSASEFREMEINWASGSILIQPENVDSIQISEFGKGEAMDIQIYGSKACIYFSEQTARNGWSSKNISSKELTVLVPVDWFCEDLEINAASADVIISDFSGKAVTFDSASGKAAFQNCRIADLELNSVSGDLTYQGTLNKLQVDALSADAEITVTNVPQKISIEAVSGSINLTLPEDAGFRIDQSLLKKSFQCDHALSQSGSSMIAGDGACDISFSGLSGSLRIHAAHHDTVHETEHASDSYSHP